MNNSKGVLTANIVVLIVSMVCIVQSFFFYDPQKIPLILFTPITGIMASLYLKKKSKIKKVFLVISSVVALIMPIYFILIFLNPDMFV
ncbi:hypothetical protein [Vagococcus silagei]|uniref:Uncharacterized protein n=1 Tax=Vagococcus silagei TaxID=2508885 RepID=A0A4S3B467_9ENTE|nr:hypothetical protein [Vagococcus silagei]THB61881.1 hypothetical protein ESZ54_02990 [Vagococcus silagei]